jgi:hypothetical protein
MSVRYFKTPSGTAQYGNLTEDGLRVLVDAGHEEITAEQSRAEEARQAEAAAALIQRGALPKSGEQTEEASTDGGNGRKRRR